MQSVGDPEASQGVPKDSDSFFTESPTLLRQQSRVRRETLLMGNTHEERGHRGPGQSGTMACALLAPPLSLGSASWHPCLPLEHDAGQARNAGLEKTSHTYPIVAYL